MAFFQQRQPKRRKTHIIPFSQILTAMQSNRNTINHNTNIHLKSVKPHIHANTNVDRFWWITEWDDFEEFSYRISINILTICNIQARCFCIWQRIQQVEPRTTSPFHSLIEFYNCDNNQFDISQDRVAFLVNGSIFSMNEWMIKKTTHSMGTLRKTLDSNFVCNVHREFWTSSELHSKVHIFPFVILTMKFPIKVSNSNSDVGSTKCLSILRTFTRWHKIPR